MEIETRYDNNRLIIKLCGELDECTANETRQKVDKCVRNNSLMDVVFDFSEVTFMDSTGIGVLLGRYKIIKKNGNNVLICGANRQIDKILTMSGIYSIMKKISY